MHLGEERIGFTKDSGGRNSESMDVGKILRKYASAKGGSWIYVRGSSWGSEFSEGGVRMRSSESAMTSQGKVCVYVSISR